jgi:hypothetical protein
MTRRLWSRLYPSEVSALVIQADFVGRSRAEPRGSCFSPACESSAPDGGLSSPQPENGQVRDRAVVQAEELILARVGQDGQWV